MHWFHQKLTWFVVIFAVSGLVALLGTVGILPYDLEPNQLLAIQIIAGVSLVLTCAGAVSG